MWNKKQRKTAIFLFLTCENVLFMRVGLLREARHYKSDFFFYSSWLYKEATVKSVMSDDHNTESLLVETVMTDAAYAKFLNRFGQPKKGRRKSEKQ